MGNGSTARPDLAAQRDSLTLPMPDLLRALTLNIGKKLTAFIASAADTKMVEYWMAGEPIPGDVEKRLRLAYQIVMTLTIQDSPAVAQAWLMGINPELGDRCPIRLLREANLEEEGALILGAARTFALLG